MPKQTTVGSLTCAKQELYTINQTNTDQTIAIKEKTLYTKSILPNIQTKFVLYYMI